MVSHWNGKIVRMTSLALTGDVEDKLQRPQWRPGQSSSRPFRFCGNLLFTRPPIVQTVEEIAAEQEVSILVPSKILAGLYIHSQGKLRDRSKQDYIKYELGGLNIMWCIMLSFRHTASHEDGGDHEYPHDDVIKWKHLPLQWRYNERDGVSNHQPVDCFLNCLFRRRSKKTSKLRVTGLGEGNSSVTGEFPPQRPVTRSFEVWGFLWSTPEQMVE